ncbi:hypothetical protein ACFQ3S_18320 [Mucilaginibacter terrae]|uniref:hypothetical protein n=1 Tax=Mucilaginibacter terrae TaxID=1955052 RepID=UPI00363663E5
MRSFLTFVLIIITFNTSYCQSKKANEQTFDELIKKLNGDESGELCFDRTLKPYIQISYKNQFKSVVTTLEFTFDYLIKGKSYRSSRTVQSLIKHGETKKLKIIFSNKELKDYDVPQDIVNTSLYLLTIRFASGSIISYKYRPLTRFTSNY